MNGRIAKCLRTVSILLSALALATVAACILAAPIPELHEEMVPSGDGTRLYTCGSLPRGDAKKPVIVLRTPYVEELGADRSYVRTLATIARLRGYLFLLQHCRGCGESEGEFVPFESEREDGLALLAWIRKQPWYNGEILLFGGSYHSLVHWSYLGSNPPDVKGAVLPVMDVDRYGAAYRNGVFKSALYGHWMKSVYRRKDRALKRDESVTFADFPLADWARRYYGVAEPSIDNVLAHPRRDDPFWLSGEPGSGAVERRAFLDSKIPVLLVTGAYDMFCEGMCDMWRTAPRARTANCALLVDAYDHDGRLPEGMKGTRGEFKDGGRLANPMKIFDWFDYCRTGKPCAFPRPGEVRFYSLWENRWLGEEALADGPRKVELPLGTGIRSWTYDPKRPLPEFPGSGGMCFGGMSVQGAPDFRDDVVSFVLTPAEEEIAVRGRMEASLAVSSDCEDTCFFVRVSVDKGEGRWYLLRDDVTTMCADGSEYAPGSWKTLSLKFPDLAFLLEKGDRLRVDVSSACTQFAPHGNVRGVQNFVTEPKVAKNSVDAGSSRLVLHAALPARRR